MVVLQLHPVTSLFVVGTRIEGILCIILLAFWAATVAIVSDASHGLAVNEDGAVQNGNLYYFSWAGFVTAILLTVSYLRGVFGVDVAGELQNRSARLTTWSGLLASSLIVLGACANIFDQDCSPQVESDTYCQRTKYGLSLGAVATTFCSGCCGIKDCHDGCTVCRGRSLFLHFDRDVCLRRCVHYGRRGSRICNWKFVLL